MDSNQHLNFGLTVKFHDLSVSDSDFMIKTNLKEILKFFYCHKIKIANARN